MRNFSQDVLALPDLGPLLWAAQRITHADNLRIAPSAGGRYPLEVIVVAGTVTGLAPAPTPTSTPATP